MTATLYSLPSPQSVPQSPSEAEAVSGLRRRMFTGLISVGFLVFGIGGWAFAAKLNGAVIATGQIVVDSNSKKVQHPTGGVVGEILVKGGSRVKLGDVLIRLDDTQTRAALGIIVSQLTQLNGRMARLTAQRDQLERVTFSENYLNSAERARRVAAGETRLFKAERETIESQKAQLRQRVGQLRREIEGLTSQREAKVRELELVRSELKRVEDMYRRRLTPITRVLAMQRDEARIDGEHGALAAQIARSEAQITETELQILTLDQTMRSEAQKEIREIEGQIAELQERKVAAEDQLRRVDITAPRSGIVHELSVHTVGGVINAAEPLMLIVPTEDRLTIEVRVAPADIDQIRIGQPTILRFSAFNQRTTPEVPGLVTRIAADLTTEAQTNQTYYLVRIKADEKRLAELNGLVLVPGMPVEGFIQTGTRTALSYIAKPLTDHFARTFREE